jgi:hypothetical protein
MSGTSLEELSRAAAEATEPRLVAEGTTKIGGVDPLGLREINFDLMDQVLPDFNNTARHLRPFVVTAWAWRRAKYCAEQQGDPNPLVDDLKDFVARVEVLYAWSHFLHDSKTDLPGRDVLIDLVRADKYVFGGNAWAKRKRKREASTSFTAAINYGPEMKKLAWLAPVKDGRGVMTAGSDAAVEAALNAFEAEIADRLDHPAFSRFGEVEVTAEEARSWREGWAIEKSTPAERKAMALALRERPIPTKRSAGYDLLIAASEGFGLDEGTLRRRMCGAPTSFVAEGGLEVTRAAWYRLQLRQAFRLALEGLFYWMTGHLEKVGSSKIEPLVQALIEAMPDRRSDGTAGDWLSRYSLSSPIDGLDAISRALRNKNDGELARAVADTLAFCLLDMPVEQQLFERQDRLPLARAQQETQERRECSVAVFLRHVFEAWILAQHLYWSVGRALNDSRARGKSLLRMRIVLEEDGWTLAPGVNRGNPPVPTPDRLGTAISLGKESGLLA